MPKNTQTANERTILENMALCRCAGEQYGDPEREHSGNLFNSLLLSHERSFKLRRLAERCHVNVPQLIDILVDKAIFNVELEAEDYEQIANELRHEHSKIGIGNT